MLINIVGLGREGNDDGGLNLNSRPVHRNTFFTIRNTISLIFRNTFFRIRNTITGIICLTECVRTAFVCRDSVHKSISTPHTPKGTPKIKSVVV